MNADWRSISKTSWLYSVVEYNIITGVFVHSFRLRTMLELICISQSFSLFADVLRALASKELILLRYNRMFLTGSSEMTRWQFQNYSTIALKPISCFKSYYFAYIHIQHYIFIWLLGIVIKSPKQPASSWIIEVSYLWSPTTLIVGKSLFKYMLQYTVTSF